MSRSKIGSYTYAQYEKINHTTVSYCYCVGPAGTFTAGLKRTLDLCIVLIRKTSKQKKN